MRWLRTVISKYLTNFYLRRKAPCLGSFWMKIPLFCELFMFILLCYFSFLLDSNFFFLIDDRRTQGVSNLYHLGTHSQFETDANKRRRKEKLWRRVTNKRSQLDESLSVWFDFVKIDFVLRTGFMFCGKGFWTVLADKCMLPFREADIVA